MPFSPRHPGLSSWLLISALGATGCPSQELAPINPCTVSGVSIDAAQSGIDQVDLLFVIDSSGSMAQEQVKLRAQIPRLVQVLTSGDLDGMPNPNGQRDFAPVSSLHLGVVSVDLGVNGEPNILGCAGFGDEGRLLSATTVALQGVVDPITKVPLVPARPECANVSVPRFISFESQSSSIVDVAQQFSCVSQLGIGGCGYEQQLESMWRALAPSTNNTFSRGALGQGAPMGHNTGFLRDDAVLAVIMVSDEEDCSSPDQSGSSLYSRDVKTANVLCARNPDKLHDVQRYVTGLRSLKQVAYQDRVIFAGIVGVPKSDRTAGLSLEQILELPEMQVAEDTVDVGTSKERQISRPTCRANAGAGDAAPARRMVEVARAFAGNGVVTSICEDDYGPALNAILAKIAAKLKGQCLPRKLTRNPDNKVECSVVEIKNTTDQTPCDPAKGRIRELAKRKVGGVWRTVCEVQQLPVLNKTVPLGAGWYYDDFSADALACMQNKQQIAFTSSAPLANGAAARFECFQSVARVIGDTRGVEAVNTPCTNDGSDGPSGDPKCGMLSLPDQPLLCVEGACQLACSSDAQCQHGYVCAPDLAGRGHCVNPTCPISQE